jgi:hypothetical protein
VVIVGMLAATLIAIFLIPVTFYLVEKLSMKVRRGAPEITATAPAPATGD